MCIFIINGVSKKKRYNCSIYCLSGSNSGKGSSICGGKSSTNIVGNIGNNTSTNVTSQILEIGTIHNLEWVDTVTFWDMVP